VTSDPVLIPLFVVALLTLLWLLFGTGRPASSGRRPHAPNGTYQYRPRHSRCPFTFNLVKQPDGEVRIYILSGPSYRSRPTDGHSTHRYVDQRNRRCVCIEHSLRPTNFRDAKSWARYWADKTALYIKTGRPFS
jgi:hypothetical protein